MVSEADRSAALEKLARHHAAGHLSGEQFRERTELAISATGRAELKALTAGLPDVGDSVPATGAARITAGRVDLIIIAVTFVLAILLQNQLGLTEVWWLIPAAFFASFLSRCILKK